MRERLFTAGRSLRPILDRLYTTSGGVAALALIAILGIMLAQVLARWTGTTFPGSTNYAGYAMASASFFAFAYALSQGAHIRVSLFLQRFTGSRRRAAELWCYGVGSFLACYFAWFAVKAVRVSYRLGDVSQGQDATPLWIPQLVMGFGTVVLAIALIDRFLQILFGADLTAEQGSSMAGTE